LLIIESGCISELLAGHYMLLICFLTGDLFLHMLWAKGIIKTLGIGIANRAAVFSITEKHGFGVLHCAACQGHLDVCKYLVEELEGDPNITGYKGTSLTLQPF